MCDLPIYLVSLKQDVERRRRLEERFSSSYCKFKYVEAVDGRKLSAKTYFEKTQPFFKLYNRIMSPAELGCTLSHIKALEFFLASGEDFALILEDDIVGNDEDLCRISQLVKGLSGDSVLLCGGQTELAVKRHRYGKYLKDLGFYQVSRFSYKFVYGTCCYVIGRESAKEILDYHFNNHVTLADKWSVFFKGVQPRIYFKDILKHPEDLTDSHIEVDRNINKKTLFQKIFSAGFFMKVIKRIGWEVKGVILRLLGYSRL